MPNYTKLPGQRGSIYSLEGFCYYQDKVSADGKTIYLKCKDGLTSSGGTCSGRAVLKVDPDHLTQTKPHSHSQASHENESLIREFKAKLKVATEECSTGLLRECYDRVASATPDSARLVPFKTVESTMALWRRQHFPRNPDSPTAVTQAFQRFAGQVSHKFALYFKEGATTDAGSFLILMNSDEAVKRALKTTESVQADGTFRSAPKSYYQVVHMFLEASDVVFCFASVWLTGKTEQLYTQAFNALKKHIPRECKPKVLMTDFEIALQNGLKSMFPEADLSGCMFHFCQGVFRNLMKIGLSKVYKTNRKFKAWVHMVFCIPLLPAEKIVVVWDFLKTEKFSAPPLEKQMIARLKVYMERQWILGVGPACLSVCGCENRTNNSAETFNRYLNRRAKVAHPNVFSFGEIVTETLQKTAVELQSLEQGLPVRRNNKNTIMEKNVQIRLYQERVQRGDLEPVVFLAKVAPLCRGYHHWLARNVAQHLQRMGGSQVCFC